MTVTHSDAQLLKEEFKDTFSTKDELMEFKSKTFDKLDEILHEVVANREERVIVSHRLSEHEDRITNLEKSSALH